MDDGQDELSAPPAPEPKIPDIPKVASAPKPKPKKGGSR